jgi:hypothetical protein
MNYKTLQCREHGGSFEVVAKRGRQRVRCTEDNVCDMHPALQQKKVSPAVKRGIKAATANPRRVPRKKPTDTELLEANQARFKKPHTTIPVDASLRVSKYCKCSNLDRERHERGIEGCKYATRGAPVVVKRAPTKGGQLAQSLKGVITEPEKASEAPKTVVRHNPSIQFARKAKEQLEPLGWECKGRAWFDEAEAWSEVTATRGIETLIIQWKNGKLDSQNYLPWNEDIPQENAMPAHRLPFNPNEMTDSELIRAIAGCKVTWWNRIAQGDEHGVLGDKIQIEHAFAGGNESARIVKFADAESKRFRAFHVSALMKVG